MGSGVITTGTVRPKFAPRDLAATPGAIEAMQAAGQELTFLLFKHVTGDWGDVSPGDAKLNDQALVDGDRLLSAYRTLLGVKLWVITEAVGDDAQRAATTILLPEDD